MRWSVALLAPAIALSAVSVRAEDAVHDAIQGLLDAVQAGTDLSKTTYDRAFAPETAEKLWAMKACSLNSVTRSQGDGMALVHWNCLVDGSPRKITAMLTFEQSKIASVEFVSFVQVDAR